MTDERQVIRALIVDDQELVRSGLSLILRETQGIVVVAECSDGDEVVDAVARHRPDVVVMDLRMKRVDGIEATRLLAEAEGPPVLALTTFNDDDLLSGVLRAGAAGFVLKDSPAEDLIRAVRAVGSGASYLDPSVTARVLTAYRSTAAATAEIADLDELTPREYDVLLLIARGHTNAEIADVLTISGLTVKTHVGHIFMKLGLRDRAAAIVFAYQNHLVEPR
ncbi:MULTISPECIES: response regulator transcription factor [unclassified Mycobacterium]|uniref:response regulator transcription factor n=1 Tax=unclassified Mycobacterium TaxID=2642494 RepID=UPI0029C95ED6|nr:MULTISPECIES: response regulator transcription factor [unclassified Mycobacterium]